MYTINASQSMNRDQYNIQYFSDNASNISDDTTINSTSQASLLAFSAYLKNFAILDELEIDDLAYREGEDRAGDALQVEFKELLIELEISRKLASQTREALESLNREVRNTLSYLKLCSEQSRH